MKRQLFICKCSSLEHILVVSTEEEDLFVEMHLAPLPFMQRLRNAIRYVFGYRSAYGDFEEIVLDTVTALDLGDYLIRWSEGEVYDFSTNDVY